MTPHVFPRLRALVASIFRRAAMDRAMHDEFALHLELRTADLIRSGMSRNDAERQARLEFGNVTAAKETARRSWGTMWFDRLEQDLRFALRTLRKNPGFTAVALLSLGFGIGATTTLFSVIDALDFRPLPYRDGDRLVFMAEVTPPDHEICSRCAYETAAPTAADWAAQTRSYEGVAVVSTTSFSWEHDNVTETVRGGVTTPGLFRVLGVRPLLGRDFVPNDSMPGAEPVVLVSYSFWQTRLGGDPNIVGSRLTSQTGAKTSPTGRPVTVAGVLPSDFHFLQDPKIWSLMALDVNWPRTRRSLTVIGRLKPGISIAAASAELRTVSARLALTYPLAYRGWGAKVEPLRNRLVWGSGKGRFVLFAITTLVLCIAVLNVAGLLLGRAAARQQEFAMRSALGASRVRLLGQLLVEGSCIGLGGGFIGILLALWGGRFAARWFSTGDSGLAVAIDHRIVAFAVAISLIVGLVAAVPPALRTARMDLRSGLSGRAISGGGAGAARASNTLIIMQVAMGLVLLTVAGLLSRDFLELRYLDLGYNPNGLYRTSIVGTQAQLNDPASWRVVAEDARARLAEIPGIVAASLEHESAIHPQIVRPDVSVTLPSSTLTPHLKAVDPAYFTAWGTRLLLGRAFTVADRPGTPLVAILNKAAASTFWPGQNPLGRRVFVGDSGSIGEVLTVVGVAANAERLQMVERHWPMIYRPFEQAKIYHAVGSVYVRVAANTPELFSAAQAAIRQATGQPVEPFVPDEERLNIRLLSQRYNAIALDLFAAFGLLLVAMGIYGSIAYAVTQRTREIGIRLALGAQRWSILGLLARRGIVLAIAGALVGIAGAFALTRVLRSFMLGTSVTNPWVFVASGLLMIVVALLATFLPAHRATRLDAVIALRAE